MANFETMVRVHDLTHEYSDDGEVWRKGHEAFQEIKRKARELDREFVRKVWNDQVDKKIVPAGRKDFYWRDAWFEEKDH